MTPPPPRSTLFPYTTLFRSRDGFVPAVLELARAQKEQLLAKPVDKAREKLFTQLSSSSIEEQRAIEAADKRSEEHTSELQSRPHLVCRLLLEKKKKKKKTKD